MEIIVIVGLLLFLMHKAEQKYQSKRKYKIIYTQPPAAEIAPPEQEEKIMQATADVERLQALRGEYLQVLDALEEEISAVQYELNSATTGAKRRTSLAGRKTALLSRRATLTARIGNIDRQIEKAYAIAHK